MLRYKHELSQTELERTIVVTVLNMETTREFFVNNCRSERCRIFVILTIFTAAVIAFVVLFHAAFKSPILPLVFDTRIHLQQVSIIFRHGDRNPLSSYPNDPHRDHVWPNGWGALTKKGMRQLYRLGKRLRGMYGPFIGDKYRTEDIIVRSSFKDRCIMSAQALMASFYQPSIEDEFEPGLAWQPVPVHEIPKEMDKWIGARAPCPRLDRELEFVRSNFRLSSNESLSSLCKEVSIYSGMEISSAIDVALVFDTLQVEVFNGLELPTWVENSYYLQLKQVYNDALTLYTSNLSLKRLTAGPLLKEILENMKRRRDGTGKHKFHLYSGHDVTQVGVIRAMGITDEILSPEYGSALIFELHKIDGGQDHEVKVSYLNNSDTTEPHIIEIPGCGDPCLLDDLFQIFKQVLPENWERECLYA